MGDNDEDARSDESGGGEGDGGPGAREVLEAARGVRESATT